MRRRTCGGCCAATCRAAPTWEACASLALRRARWRSSRWTSAHSPATSRRCARGHQLGLPACRTTMFPCQLCWSGQRTLHVWLGHRAGRVQVCRPARLTCGQTETMCTVPGTDSAGSCAGLQAWWRGVRAGGGGVPPPPALHLVPLLEQGILSRGRRGCELRGRSCQPCQG